MSVQIKKKLHGDLKNFARAEMARDMAKRHGKSLQLPWDPDHDGDAPPGGPPAAAGAHTPPGVDEKDLEELMEHLRGGG